MAIQAGSPDRDLGLPLSSSTPRGWKARNSRHLARAALVRVSSAECQHPVFDVATAGIEPHDVANAVVVEVVYADRNRPNGVRPHVDAACPVSVLDQPDVDIVRGRIVPRDIAGAVLVEIAAPKGCHPVECEPTSTLPAHCPFAIFQMSTAPV